MPNPSGGNNVHPRKTSASIKAIVDAWNKGRTSGELAITFGTTRNAIMGLISRARESGIKTRTGTKNSSVITQKKPKPTLSAPKTPEAPKKLRYRPVKVKATIAPPRPKKAVRKLPTRPKFKGVPISDLLPNACRWIEGPSKPNALYCGEPGFPWCKHHHQRVYVKWIPK